MSVPVPPPLAPERTSHPFLTHDMIHAIPSATRATLRNAQAPATEAGRMMADRDFLYFTGCGTAFFSSMLAERLAAAFGVSRVRTQAVPALELSAYTSRVDARCGVVGVSHSGITKATVDALRASRGHGAKTVGITHFADRPIAAVSDATILAGDGPDRSRCHTKCYVTGALAAALVGLEWTVAAGSSSRDAVDATMASMVELPSLQETTLRTVENVCSDAAATHLSRTATFILGSGPNESTAQEVALKLKETSFIAAEGMETEQFIHGSWQALNEDCLVIVIALAGPGHERALDILRAGRTVGSHTVAIATEGDREVEQASELTISIPPVAESLSPFLAVIPLYLYAYHSSVKRGHNPDVLRYLEPRYWAARNIVFPPGTH